MNDTATGLLAVWMDAAPAGEADFNAWYSQEHVPERVGVPGFLNGCRYAVLSGSPRYLAVYDLERPEVLESAPYRARLNGPTPWTQRVMPHFRNTVRSACSVLAGHGAGIGGVLRALRIEPQEGRRDALRDGLRRLVQTPLAAAPGLRRVRLAEAAAAPPAQTAEIALRGPDRVASFVLLLDGDDAATLDAACGEALADARLAALGAAKPVERGDYRLVYALVRGR